MYGAGGSALDARGKDTAPPVGPTPTSLDEMLAVGGNTRRNSSNASFAAEHQHTASSLLRGNGAVVVAAGEVTPQQRPRHNSFRIGAASFAAATGVAAVPSSSNVLASPPALASPPTPSAAAIHRSGATPTPPAPPLFIASRTSSVRSTSSFRLPASPLPRGAALGDGSALFTLSSAAVGSKNNHNAVASPVAVRRGGEGRYSDEGADRMENGWRPSSPLSPATADTSNKHVAARDAKDPQETEAVPMPSVIVTVTAATPLEQSLIPPPSPVVAHDGASSTYYGESVLRAAATCIDDRDHTAAAVGAAPSVAEKADAAALGRASPFSPSAFTSTSTAQPSINAGVSGIGRGATRAAGASVHMVPPSPSADGGDARSSSNGGGSYSAERVTEAPLIILDPTALFAQVTSQTTHAVAPVHVQSAADMANAAVTLSNSAMSGHSARAYMHNGHSSYVDAPLSPLWRTTSVATTASVATAPTAAVSDGATPLDALLLLGGGGIGSPSALQHQHQTLIPSSPNDSAAIPNPILHQVGGPSGYGTTSADALGGVVAVSGGGRNTAEPTNNSASPTSYRHDVGNGAGAGIARALSPPPHPKLPFSPEEARFPAAPSVGATWEALSAASSEYFKGRGGSSRVAMEWGRSAEEAKYLGGGSESVSGAAGASPSAGRRGARPSDEAGMGAAATATTHRGGTHQQKALPAAVGAATPHAVNPFRFYASPPSAFTPASAMRGVGGSGGGITPRKGVSSSPAAAATARNGGRSSYVAPTTRANYDAVAGDGLSFSPQFLRTIRRHNADVLSPFPADTNGASHRRDHRHNGERADGGKARAAVASVSGHIANGPLLGRGDATPRNRSTRGEGEEDSVIASALFFSPILHPQPLGAGEGEGRHDNPANTSSNGGYHRATYTLASPSSAARATAAGPFSAASHANAFSPSKRPTAAMSREDAAAIAIQRRVRGWLARCGLWRWLHANAQAAEDTQIDAEMLAARSAFMENTVFAVDERIAARTAKEAANAAAEEEAEAKRSAEEGRREALLMRHRAAEAHGREAEAAYAAAALRLQRCRDGARADLRRQRAASLAERLSPSAIAERRRVWAESHQRRAEERWAREGWCPTEC